MALRGASPKHKDRILEFTHRLIVNCESSKSISLDYGLSVGRPSEVVTNAIKKAFKCHRSDLYRGMDLTQRANYFSLKAMRANPQHYIDALKDYYSD